MDDKEIGRIWAEFYSRSGGSSDALQMCGMICRLIREKSRFVFAIRRSVRLQRVLDNCGIRKTDFDEVEKALFKV